MHFFNSPPTVRFPSPRNTLNSPLFLSYMRLAPRLHDMGYNNIVSMPWIISSSTMHLPHPPPHPLSPQAPALTLPEPLTTPGSHRGTWPTR